MARCYDTRYFVLPLFNFLKTHPSSTVPAAGVDKIADGSSLLAELMSLTVLSALFLLMSIRIQFCCFFHALPRFGRIELRIGGTELSVPLTLSLIVTLLAPSDSAFWSIYFFILVSYHLCFVVWRDHESTLPAPHGDEESVLPTSSNHFRTSEH